MEKTESGGDPLPEKKRRIGRPKLISVAIILLTAATAFNAFRIGAIGGGIPFAGTSLFNITPSFALGSNPAGASITPGSSLSFTLSVQSAIAHTMTLSFNSSNTTAWSANARAGTGCGTQTSFPGAITMTLAGSSPVVPINYAGPAIGCGGDVSAEQTVTVNMVPGVNTFSGTISVATTASSSISFTTAFFGQVV